MVVSFYLKGLYKSSAQYLANRCSSLLRIGSNPEISNDAGIYLHILWRENDHDMFWLYVGQASDFSDRMKNHNDPLRRYRNPSLHYHIWDSIQDINSVFVTLGTYTKAQCVEDQLILNLGEMWMCLIFQTLRPLHLEQFLPQDVRLL